MGKIVKVCVTCTVEIPIILRLIKAAVYSTQP